MCVIIYKPPGIPLIKNELLACEETFSDGIGFVSFNPKTGKLTKGKAEKDVIKLLANWNKIKNNVEHETIIHFRKASIGAVCRENIQPLCTDKYIYAHNGTMTSISKYAPKGLSDSHALGSRFLSALDLEIEAHNEIFEKFINPSRVIVMDKETGDVKIFNEGGGTWRNGLWYSNVRWLTELHKIGAAAKRSKGGSNMRQGGYPENLYLSSSFEKEKKEGTQMSHLSEGLKVKDGTGRKNEPIHTVPYNGPGRPFQDIPNIWVWKGDQIYHQQTNKNYHWKDYPVPEVRKAVSEYFENLKKQSKPRRKITRIKPRVQLMNAKENKMVAERIRSLSFITREDGLCWRCLAPVLASPSAFTDHAECQHCLRSRMLKSYEKL